MSEHDANRAMLDSALLRALSRDAELKLVDELETTIPLPVSTRRMRQLEARGMRTPDFRDGRCVHGGGRYSCPTCGTLGGRRE